MLFDPAPLLAQARLAIDLPDLGFPDETIRHLCDEELGKYIGVSRKTVLRWRHGTRVKRDVADRTALALGLHPLNIWPDWFVDTNDEVIA